MALAIQPDLVALPVYVGFPVYYLLTNRKWSQEDETMYAELRARSYVFPAFKLRWIFWAVWVCLYPACGVGGYLLWHEADEMPSDHFYMGILGCYWTFIMLSFAWMSFYQDHEMQRYNWRGGILAGSAVAMFLLAVAVMVMSIIAEQLVPAIIFGVASVWLAYAGVMSIRIAMLLPFLPMVVGRFVRWAEQNLELEKRANMLNPTPASITTGGGSDTAQAASQYKSGMITNADLAYNIGTEMHGNNGKFQATKLEMPQAFKKIN